MSETTRSTRIRKPRPRRTTELGPPIVRHTPGLAPWDAEDPRLTPVFLRREVIAEGVHDREIARRVRDGTWARVRRGAYVAGAAWSDLDEDGRMGLRTRAVLKQANSHAIASHLSAAVEWGAPLVAVDRRAATHITRIDGRAGRREAGVVQHLGEIRTIDRHRRNGIELTSPARTVVDVSTLVSTESALVVADHMLSAKLMSYEEFDECIEFARRWPGTLSTDMVRRLSDPRSESAGETRTRYLCWRQGLPSPTPQFEVRDDRGEIVARLDFAWPEWGVFVEFDGRTKYVRPFRDGDTAEDVVLREKRREERVCELTGWICIRITWADLNHPERTAARIRRALERGRKAA